MVTFTPEQIDRAVRLLEHLPGAAQKAMARALNRAMEGAKTRVVRAIRAEYNVDSARIRLAFKDSRKATATNLTAAVRTAERRPTLYRFGPTPDKPGTGGRFAGVGMTRPPLRVAVKRDSAPKPIGGAFVVRAGGNLLVAVRKGAKRFPIRALYGPAFPQMMGRVLRDEAVAARVEAVAQQRLDARLSHEVFRELERASR